MMLPALWTLHMLRCAAHRVPPCLYNVKTTVCCMLRSAQLCNCTALSKGIFHLLQGLCPHTTVLQVTCSARGHCNYATGLCQCDAGWEGSACERLACPVTGSGVTAKTCNGRGACLTMAAAAARYNGRNLVRPYVSYTTPWDAHKIQVCGYSVYNCCK
jgi:EGF-like domain